MTYIEFFDKTASENICACLAKVPERVIFIGDKLKLLQSHSERYRSILLNRGYDVEFICRNINKNNMQMIIDELSQIVETYDNCVFDLTGGDDLYLVAAGIISERYRDKNIQMHRFNIRHGSVIDCDRDGNTILEDNSISLSVEENIRAYGGDIVPADVKSHGTYKWRLDSVFRMDIYAMWDICKQNVRLWNTQIGVFQIAERFRDKNGDILTTTASVPQITAHLKKSKAKFVFIKRIVESLRKSGILTDYFCDEYTLSLTYKNEQVKRCLTKAGQVLEMKIFLAACDVRDDDNRPVYNDVLNGVCIDWDGKIHTSGSSLDTENEIDVMMMHGVIPVFVSCKNGHVDIDELYKLHSVADRFGKQYSKKILVATSLGSSGEASLYLRQRATDMGIRIVDNVQSISNAELSRIVKSFWSN